MIRVLVTGASGFIGRAILRRLEEEGHEVLGFKGNLLSADWPKELGATPSHCIHSAWYTNHADYLTHRINPEWTRASLRLADRFAEAGGKRFIGLGTCLEYDVANVSGPCSEEWTPLRPSTVYARSKLELLKGLKQRARNFAWARIFFVYGPGDRAGRLVSHMLNQFSRGKKAGPKYGGLRRDYIHVDDLADQIVRIALSDVQGAINSGTGRAPTLSEMFAAAAKAFDKPELACGNSETGAQPQLIQADMSRFKREVGEPQARHFESGIRALIQ